MAMPKPRYRTPEEWQELVNSKRWQEFKTSWLARGNIFGPGL